MNIYRLDDDAQKPMPLEFDTVKEFAKLDFDPDKREELIGQAFGNYIVTLGMSLISIVLIDSSSIISLILFLIQKAMVLHIENVRMTMICFENLLIIAKDLY